MVAARLAQYDAPLKTVETTVVRDRSPEDLLVHVRATALHTTQLQIQKLPLHRYRKGSDGQLFALLVY